MSFFGANTNSETLASLIYCIVKDILQHALPNVHPGAASTRPRCLCSSDTNAVACPPRTDSRRGLEQVNSVPHLWRDKYCCFPFHQFHCIPSSKNSMWTDYVCKIACH